MLSRGLGNRALFEHTTKRVLGEHAGRHASFVPEQVPHSKTGPHTNEATNTLLCRPARHVEQCSA